jgi:hypothetical protein
VASNCRAAAAALATKHSSRDRTSSSSGKHHESRFTALCEDTDDAYDCGDMMGLDPCSYKLSFEGPGWLTRAVCSSSISSSSGNAGDTQGSPSQAPGDGPSATSQRRALRWLSRLAVSLRAVCGSSSARRPLQLSAGTFTCHP